MSYRKYLICFSSIATIIILAGACNREHQKQSLKDTHFPPNLSTLKLFQEPITNLIPVQGVIPYELNTPLFTDYAFKSRFIKLPEGHTIKVNNEDLEFPLGTVLIKNFFYHKDERVPSKGKQIIETRLLVKTIDGWEVGVYEWNEEQTEAVFIQLGNKKAVSWKGDNGEVRNIDYVIPDINDCKGCHLNDGDLIPIGPKLRNLNYVNNDGLWQIDDWLKKGFLVGIKSHLEVERLPVWTEHEQFSLNERARAYLDVNCAHCHTAKGPADNTGLFLEYEQADHFKIGVGKGPVSAGIGSANLKYDIVPGRADSSIIYYRMQSTETGIAMPELGRTVNHDEGLTLIKDWINLMD